MNHNASGRLRAPAPVVVTVVTLALLAAPSAHAAFNFRKLITVDSNEVSGSTDLIDFPVLVNLTDPNLRTTGNGGGVENASGFDIIFRGADGVTNLDHEVELYDPVAGTLVAWVRIPVLDHDEDTWFYLYYGDSSIVASQENPTAVWDSNYRAVWHLEEVVTDEATGGIHDDSTVNNRDGTQSRNVNAPGKIANAQDFDGSDHINLGSGFPALGATFTIEGWVWFDVLGGNPTLFARQNFTNIDYRVVADPALRVDLSYDGTEPGDAFANPPAAVVTGRWYHFAAVKSATELRMYLDGVSGAPTATAGTVNHNAALAVRMARRQDGGQALDGKLDEVRVSSVARSPEWIVTEYNNQNNASTFLQAGPQQAIGGCPPLGVSQTGGRITIGAPDSFEMVFDTATGGSIREFYDLAESPTRSAANDFAGGISDGIEALYNQHLQVSGTSYSTARDDDASIHLLEATSARARVRQDASYEEKSAGNKLAGVKGVGDYSIYPAGRLALTWNRRATQNVTYTSNDFDMSIHYHPNPPAPTMDTWTAFSSGGGAFPQMPGDGDYLLTRIDEVGAKTDFLNIIYRDWTTANGHLADATEVNFTTKATTEWVDPHWVHSSAGALIPAGSSERWNFLTYFKPTTFVNHLDGDVTGRSADYRTPDPLSVSVGTGWNENQADGDFFNESEAAYTLDFEMSAGLTFSINGATTTRYSPFFKIRQWRSLQGSPVVTLDAVPLVVDTDFKADIKPISDADFADRIFYHTTLQSFAAVTGADIGDGTGASESGVTYVTGRYGMGALFDSLTDWIRVPIVVGGQNNLEWDRGRIEFWYLPSSDHVDNAQHYLFDADNDGVAGGSRVRIKKEDNTFANQLTVEVTDSAGLNHTLNIPATNYQWKAGHWVHVAMQWDGATGVLRASLNGVQLVSAPPYVPTPFAMEVESVSGYIRIGNKAIGPCCFDGGGIIDEFTVYNQRDPTQLAYGGLASDANEYLVTASRNASLPFAAADSARRGEYLFLGSDAKFRGLNIGLQTQGAGTSPDLQWEYWDGIAWADLEGVTGFTDELNDLTAKSGAIYWTTDPPGWSEYSVNGGPDLFYLRAHLASGSYSTLPVEALIKTDILLFQHCGELTGLAQTFDFDIPRPTAVELTELDAEGHDGEVLLAWKTGSELHNLGFHVYRAEEVGGPYEQLTTTAIPGLGSSPSGAIYHYRDRGVVNGLTYYYELEDIETSGKRGRHGPVSATPHAGAGAPPGPAPAPGEKTSLITYGNPSAGELQVRGYSRWRMSLELTTPGFYAEPQPDGSVGLYIPGFDELQEGSGPGVPVKRSWVEAIAGMNVEIVSVQAYDVSVFTGLRPSVAETHVVSARRDGTVRAVSHRDGRRSRSQHVREHELFPAEAARVLSVGFQGDVKKAWVELAPLRWDEATGRLLLARRLVVTVAFQGADATESRGARRVRERGDREGRTVASRFVTTERGLQGVRYEDIFGRARRRVDASTIRLSRQGNPVAFHVEPNVAHFGPGMTLYFLGEGARANPYGTEAVYELDLDLGEPGLPMPARSAAPSGGGADPASFYWHHIELEEDRMYQPALVDAPELWLWDLVFAPDTKAFPFQVSHLAPGAPRLSVWLQGASDFPVLPDHHVRVYVNGSLLTELSWDGKQARRVDVDLMAGVLREGENTLELDNVGDTGAAYSMVLLDRFAVDYPRMTLATDGRLEGRWSQSGVTGVRGLAPGAFVLDITDTQPSWLTGTAVASDGTLSFFADAGRRYLAVNPASVHEPVVQTPRPSRLRSTQNQADYLVVGPLAFLPAATRLLEHRRDQGLTTMSVSTEDIYSEFGFGEATPGAIRDFLTHAYHAWRTAPRYVVLLGDATYDFKDNLSTGLSNRVPPLMVRTSYLWTASDPTYAAVNGDDILPDLAIGRLPAATFAEAQAMVAKILAYETAAVSVDGPTVLVADNADEAGNFEADADALASNLLASRDVIKVYLSQLGKVATRDAVVQSFDDGASLMSYLGHGGIHLWASENVLDVSGVSSLSPQSQQPVLLTMNCLNGYYHFPYFNSLSEELVKAEGRGAIAAFSPSGLSLNDPAHLYHQALLREILNGGHLRLGDAILAAQSTYAGNGAFPELLSIYHLLGDPALTLR